jgi:cytochrome c peroxidase
MRALLVLAIAACAEPRVDDPWQWELPARFPVPRVPADNPMTAEKVELGRHLFFDPRLSNTGTQACASCHDPAHAFTDGRTTAIGASGDRGTHNTMSLVNVAYNSSSTWAHDVRRLEEQARLPMFSPLEMGASESEVLARLAADPVYRELFDAAGEPITIDGVTRALASFERTIISASTRFDRFIAGEPSALDASEQRGLALFESERLGCARCHGGFNLASAYDHAGMTAPQIQQFNTGLYNVDGRGAYPVGDQGLVEVTGDPADMGRFRAPTLRNIALTAPYFHDGSAPTLDAVIDHYARAGVASPLVSPFITGFTLSAAERADLLAFLGALTDDRLATSPQFTSPW